MDHNWVEHKLQVVLLVERLEKATCPELEVKHNPTRHIFIRHFEEILVVLKRKTRTATLATSLLKSFLLLLLFQKSRTSAFIAHYLSVEDVLLRILSF